MNLTTTNKKNSIRINMHSVKSYTVHTKFYSPMAAIYQNKVRDTLLQASNFLPHRFPFV